MSEAKNPQELEKREKRQDYLSGQETWQELSKQTVLWLSNIGLLITTEAMVAERPKKETPMPAMPPGGGMDY